MATDTDPGNPKHWLVAAGYSQFTAALWFEGDIERDLHEKAGFLSIGRMLNDTYMLRVSAARLLTGEITGGPHTAQIQPGWTFGASLSRRYTVDGYPKLFIGGSAALSVKLASATYGGDDPTTSLWAGDLRIGSTVGWVLFERFVPYAALRVFGGPVNWRADKAGKDLGGTDRYHFQLGGGLSIALPAGFYATTEYIPLGERSFSAELGARF